VTSTYLEQVPERTYVRYKEFFSTLLTSVGLAHARSPQLGECSALWGERERVIGHRYMLSEY